MITWKIFAFGMTGVCIGFIAIFIAMLKLITEASREIERLRNALLDAREEIDKWGYGDFHYGDTPREPSVLAALAAIDEVLGEGLRP